MSRSFIPNGFTGELVVGTLAVDANPGNVLSAIVRVETDTATTVAVTAHNAGHTVTVPPTPFPTRLHQIPLVGLRPSTDYTLSASAVADDGTTISLGHPVSFRSGALPGDFPDIRATGNRSRMAPGLTLFNLMPWHLPTASRRAIPFGLETQPMLGYLVAVDGDGRVVWYYRAELGIEDARQLPNGDILLSYDDCMARQINVLGRTVREWASRAATDLLPRDELGRARASPGAIPLATDTLHHDVALLAWDTLLFLSTELRRVGGSANRRPATTGGYNVIGDVVVEADAASGEIVGEWALLDVLDPLARPGAHLVDGGLRSAPPVVFYPWAHAPRDWSHANAVALDERRNALLVSLRHLDGVVALRYRDSPDGAAGQLLWELGSAGNLTLVSGEWPYHQHAVEVQDDGSILLYDNGVNRPGHTGAGGAPPFSRAVRFELDDDAGPVRRVRQCWEHRLREGHRPVFARRLGDANRLRNSNVLVTHGNVIGDRGRIYARIVEVVPQCPSGGEVVFDLRVDDPRSGWCVYRAERIQSLYRGWPGGAV